MRRVVGRLVGVIATIAGAPAFAAPVAHACQGEVTEYNDGRSNAQWYSSRRAWTGRLWLDQAARTWRLEEPTLPPPFPETINRFGGGPVVGRTSQSAPSPFVADRRGLSLRDYPTEEVGRFTPSNGRLRVPDRGRDGLVAVCRAGA